MHPRRPTSVVRLLIGITVSLLLLPEIVHGGTVRRFVLSAGANNGGDERAKLRYAISDAEQFTRVMEGMGGVDETRRFLLREPKVGDLLESLSHIKERVAESRQPGDRVELILYYSGHADENGLLIGDDRLTYQSLRDQLDAVSADVHITVLDACASGAITRIKGGKREKAFLVDESSQMRGHAFLTSSSEDEVAQESDAIGGSYFTHHLVSGLRGAADVSEDGKVTLGEAYQHAFHETLAQTTDSRAGAQHPAYDISLVGTGDVVMTDLRDISAGLLLGEPLDGRFYIRNDRKQLVVELNKPAGRQITIGLEPGTYDVHFEQTEALGLARVDLREDEHLTLAASDFREVDRKEIAALRGKRRGPRPTSLERRHRFQVHFGYAETGTVAVPTAGVGTNNVMAGLLYGWWATERLMMSLSFNGLASEVSGDVSSVAALLLGVRYYFPESSLRSTLRPFVALAAGPYLGSIVGGGFVGTESAPGGFVGLGIDFPVSRWFMIGAEGGYSFVGDFGREVAGRINYSGFHVNLGLSLTIGKGVRR